MNALQNLMIDARRSAPYFSTEADAYLGASLAGMPEQLAYMAFCTPVAGWFDWLSRCSDYADKLAGWDDKEGMGIPPAYPEAS